jgi:hypothetical protein
MVVSDAGDHSEHRQVIRCDIKRESVKKCRDAENEPIQKKTEGNSP